MGSLCRVPFVQDRGTESGCPLRALALGGQDPNSAHDPRPLLPGDAVEAGVGVGMCPEADENVSGCRTLRVLPGAADTQHTGPREATD